MYHRGNPHISARLSEAGYSLDFHAPAHGVEAHGGIAEQPFDMSAADHLFGWQAMQMRRVDKSYRVGEREGDVQLVGGKQDTFPFVARQPCQKRA